MTPTTSNDPRALAEHQQNKENIGSYQHVNQQVAKRVTSGLDVASKLESQYKSNKRYIIDVNSNFSNI
jgi:hypothetical protein